MTLHLWKENAGPPMNAMHFGFGVGALIAPQVARDFLSPDPTNDDEPEALAATANNSSNNSTNSVDVQRPYQGRIEIPYAIVASLAATFALILLGFYIRGPPKNFPKKESSELSRGTLGKLMKPSSCANGDSFFGAVLFVLLFLYYIQAAGLEATFGELSSTA